MANSVIHVEGCHNFRDLGGYRCTTGNTVRSGLLYRSDGLHLLTESGQGVLASLELRTVIDLRRPSEANEEPDRLPADLALRYFPTPLFKEASPSEALSRARQPLSEIYLRAPNETKGSLARVIETVASPLTLPALFHCTAGKDRTGIVAALILDLLYVSREDIGDDYALSATVLEPLYPEYRRRARQKGLNMEEFEERLRSRPETIIRMLEKIDHEYGSSEGYFLNAGVSAETIDHLRQTLTE